MKAIIFILTISIVATANAHLTCHTVTPKAGCVDECSKMEVIVQAIKQPLQVISNTLHTLTQAKPYQSGNIDFFFAANNFGNLHKAEDLKILQSNLLENSEKQNYQANLDEQKAESQKLLQMVNEITKLKNSDCKPCPNSIEVSSVLTSEFTLIFKNMQMVLDNATYV
jgi:ribosome-binding ATPase YchF (GTP1/OBG family)